VDTGRARFQSLSEAVGRHDNPAGKLIITVFAGIAEFERDLILERTKAGRDAARGRESASNALES
jgi:DNA invertase Pin-like site-specific DNA recombinase